MFSTDKPAEAVEGGELKKIEFSRESRALTMDGSIIAFARNGDWSLATCARLAESYNLLVTHPDPAALMREVRHVVETMLQWSDTATTTLNNMGLDEPERFEAIRNEARRLLASLPKEDG